MNTPRRDFNNEIDDFQTTVFFNSELSTEMLLNSLSSPEEMASYETSSVGSEVLE